MIGFEHKRNPDQTVSKRTIYRSTHEAKANLPTEESLHQIWGKNVLWGMTILRGEVLEGEYDPKTGFNRGELGNDSAPNPLVEGLMAIYHFTLIAIQNIYSDQVPKEEMPS